ncbi:hypothetical protein M011DRAFT_463961 [Sporormia fimetaria CBS 119925]|uniref:Signal recognition particle subunit SRP72 n=1 Tax=Sporormia fimetaria CBS 119925 TaxID=1340428 RepID=A0A6A6VKU7_9PLEO|nr:hypothetical protein M011DRAFT_463961 [Sporormia fimetaria CBS 119925]
MSASVKSLSALLAQASLDDHDEILKAANAAIKKSKGDLDAQHAKAVALLKLDRYEDALKVFNDVPKLQDRARFEYAYALYKSGEADRATEVAKENASTRAMKHVLAQSAYRSENFEVAADAYKQLSTETNADEEADIKINSSAVDSQLEWANKGHLTQKKKLERDDLQAFETAYNTACWCISRDELPHAEICLKRAIELCNAAEDLTDEEKKSEILPMRVQQVYVLTRMGKIDEAEQLSTTIPFAEIKEFSSRYIAQVNSIAASTKHSNPYLSHRLFHSAPKPPKTDQLFTYQTDILRQDEYAINLFAHKAGGVKSQTAKVIDASPSPTLSPAVNTASVVHAAAHAQSQSTSHTQTLSEKAALKAILPLLEKRPNDIGLLLTITQLYVLTNNLAAATELLEAFFKRLEQSGTASDLDVRHAPGLVATLVSLYVAQGRHSHSKTGLAKAAHYWREKSETAPRSLMTAAGTALLETHHPENLEMAGEIFEALFRQDYTDRSAIAGLIAALSISDPDKLPKELINSLPDVDRLVADLDVAALEAAGVPTLPSAMASSTTTKRTAPKEDQTPAKPKRIRKSRMPKDFVAGRTMDPERWLPMRDRTYYRPKGRKGKKKMEGLTQGGAVAEDKSVDNKQTTSGGGGQKKGGGKKKKGGKW